jgi:hypothetical protein
LDLGELEKNSRHLLEIAKRYLEKAKEAKKDPIAIDAYLRACIIIAFASLESQLLYVASHFTGRKDMGVLERAVIGQFEYEFQNGVCKLTDKPKFYKLEERLKLLLAFFSGDEFKARDYPWWSNLMEGVNIRNEIVHPKRVTELTIPAAGSILKGILGAMSDIYEVVFKKKFPAAALELESRYEF